MRRGWRSLRYWDVFIAVWDFACVGAGTRNLHSQYEMHEELSGLSHENIEKIQLALGLLTIPHLEGVKPHHLRSDPESNVNPAKKISRRVC